MFELGGGMRGGWVVTPAFRKKAPAVQVTRFTETGIPAGHEEYPDLPSALAAHFDYLPHPLSRLSANTYRDQIKAWEEATFEHPYADELVKKKFVYMSPNRPLAGIWVEGEQSVDKSGRIGVLYRDDPLPFAKIESLQLVPITPEAKYAVALHLAELWQNRVGYSGAQENPPGEAMNMKKTRVPEELQDLAVWQAAIYAGGTAMDFLAANRADWAVTPDINLEEHFADGYYGVVDRAAAFLGISHEELQARLDSERDPVLKPLADAALHQWLADKSSKKKQEQEVEEYLARLEARRAELENPFEQPEPPDEQYDPRALAAGIEVEMEHTTDRRIAKRIAKDHLDEDSAYYRKLKTLGLNPGRIVITLTPRKGPGYTFQAGSFVEFRRVGREVFKAAFTAEQQRDPFMVEANGNYVGDAVGLTVFSRPEIWDDILRFAAGD